MAGFVQYARGKAYVRSTTNGTSPSDFFGFNEFFVFLRRLQEKKCWNKIVTLDFRINLHVSLETIHLMPGLVKESVLTLFGKEALLVGKVGHFV